VSTPSRAVGRRVVPALLSAALSPLAVFLAFILWITTPVSETVRVGPFTPVRS